MKKIIVMLLLLAPMTMFAQQAKFGHCDTQAILSAMPEFIKARADVEVVQKQKEDELKGMQDEFQRKVEEYQKTQSTMNESKKKETEESLAQLNQKLQQAYQDGQQELSKLSQEKMAPIQQKLVNAIQAVGKAGGYVYIMDVASGIPYISTTLSKDVTTEVKAQLSKMK
jgi:outer membrane protein